MVRSHTSLCGMLDWSTTPLTAPSSESAPRTRWCRRPTSTSTLIRSASHRTRRLSRRSDASNEIQISVNLATCTTPRGAYEPASLESRQCHQRELGITNEWFIADRVRASRNGIVYWRFFHHESRAEWQRRSRQLRAQRGGDKRLRIERSDRRTFGDDSLMRPPPCHHRRADCQL
jgi:hypothetical protein